VGGLPEYISVVVVHCEGGYSRSCAIAKALSQICGYQVSENDLVDANPSVVGVMQEVAAERSGGKGRRE